MVASKRVGTQPELSRAFLEKQIEQNLATLGVGFIDSVAYDTAWVARLAQRFPGHGYESSLEWLRQHQHADGSWGADILHYHDRVLSTLSALVALQTNTHPAKKDQERIRRGETFLWRASAYLHCDADETVAFQVLAMTLVREANTVGLNVPKNFSLNAALVEKKIRLLSGTTNSWRYSPMIFSFEAVSTYFFGKPDFIETNGSVGMSPAATSSLLMYQTNPDPVLFDYLDGVLARQHDGGAPNLSPIDIFESAWAFNHYRLVGAINADHPQAARIGRHFAGAWSPERGLSCSVHFSVPDLDDTAVGFALLQWLGYPVQADVFAAFEEDEHFRCYPAENDPSMSVNLRTLAALRQLPSPNAQVEGWIQKIIAMLRRREATGQFWTDKWHASPYYLACATIQLLHGLADDLTLPRLTWIQRTQRPDGGWGFYGESTPEETAYCLQALLFSDQHIERIDPSAIEGAASYLVAHLDDTTYTPLWIGKCLYTPRYLVRAVILSTMYSYVNR